MAATNNNGNLVYRNVARHKPHSAGEAFIYTILMVFLAALIGGGFFGLVHGYKNGWDYMAFFGGIVGGVFLVWRLIVRDRANVINKKEEEYEPPAAPPPPVVNGGDRVYNRREDGGYDVAKLDPTLGAKLAVAVWDGSLKQISARSLKKAGVIESRDGFDLATVTGPLLRLGWLDSKNQVNGAGFFGLFHYLPTPIQEKHAGAFSDLAAATPPVAATSGNKPVRGGSKNRPPRTLGQE